jgi:hypothetical protein
MRICTLPDVIFYCLTDYICSIDPYSIDIKRLEIREWWIYQRDWVQFLSTATGFALINEKLGICRFPSKEALNFIAILYFNSMY